VSVASPRARRWAVGIAIVCAALAGPGTASADDLAGVDGLVGQIQTEVSSELAAVVPQPAAASVHGDAQAATSVAVATAERVSAEALGPAGPATLSTDGSASQTDATAPATPPGAVSAFVTAAPGAARTHAPPETAGPGVRHVPPRSARRSSQRTTVRTRVSLAVVEMARSESYVRAQATVHEHVQASRADARTGSAGAAPPRRSGPAPGREPQPPAPGPNGPGTSSAGQGGGQGAFLPLVLAVLAAALAFFGFELLPRVLPLPAFRKPRRIVLPPWHPG
jgi:hypothetical protein